MCLDDDVQHAVGIYVNVVTLSLLLYCLHKGKPVFGTNPLAVGVPVKGSRPFTVRFIVFIWFCVFLFEF